LMPLKMAPSWYANSSKGSANNFIVRFSMCDFPLWAAPGYGLLLNNHPDWLDAYTDLTAPLRSSQSLYLSTDNERNKGLEYTGEHARGEGEDGTLW